MGGCTFPTDGAILEGGATSFSRSSFAIRWWSVPKSSKDKQQVRIPTGLWHTDMSFVSTSADLLISIHFDTWSSSSYGEVRRRSWWWEWWRLPFKSDSFRTVVGVLALKPMTVFESQSVFIVKVGICVAVWWRMRDRSSICTPAKCGVTIDSAATDTALSHPELGQLALAGHSSYRTSTLVSHFHYKTSNSLILARV